MPNVKISDELYRFLVEKKSKHKDITIGLGELLDELVMKNAEK